MVMDSVQDEKLKISPNNNPLYDFKAHMKKHALRSPEILICAAL